MNCFFIGGKQDGKKLDVPRGTITWEVAGEKYMAIDVRAKGAKQPDLFFMLGGMTVNNAHERYKELCSIPKSTKP